MDQLREENTIDEINQKMTHSSNEIFVEIVSLKICCHNKDCSLM